MWVVPCLYLIVLSLLCDSVISTETHLSDECDWKLSERLPHDANSRNVKQVYLRCAEGHVDWDFPFGAVRITLQLGTSGEEFRACIQPEPYHSGGNIYREGDDELLLLVAGKTKLADLKESATNEASDKYDLSRTHCFESSRGRAVLFIETTPNLDNLRKTVSFSYSLQPLNIYRHRHSLKDCMPCNNTELMNSFCSNDFVIKARMKEVRSEHGNGETLVDLGISEVFRQKDGVFTLGKHGRYEGTVSLPFKCRAKFGEGHFLMMGSTEFGKAHLHCAPRLSQFRRLAKFYTQSGLNECNLNQVLESKDDL